MVESENNEGDKLEAAINKLRICRIRCNSIEQDTLALELRRGWKNIPDSEKIEIAMSEAEFRIQNGM